ncbi:MAG TPA: MSMEG_0570 family nitrogen starvation response protein [Burkholderiaceae bacterium]
MPEMHYRLRWPDESETTCYSPSLVIRDYFEPGADYALAEFLRRIREATQTASERVRAKFGFACSRASDQLAAIEANAARFAGDAAARVHVVGFDDDATSD